MAAYGGHNDNLGIQVYVTARKGAEWPPKTCDVRVRYDQTLGELRAAAARALGLESPEQLQLFRHKRELRPEAYDSKTMLELDIHTGFGLQGWDLSVPPQYFPPVKQTPEGLVLDC